MRIATEQCDCPDFIRSANRMLWPTAATLHYEDCEEHDPETCLICNQHA